MKRKLIQIIIPVTLVLSIFVAVPGQSRSKAAPPAKATADDSRLLPLDDVRTGMKGIARTVFSGSESQEFGVEVLGVLPGYPGPRQSTIIARLSGANVDKTGVFAGMSGSPVFVDNRLIGAIAYSFPFSKEPICGITPIAQMIEIFSQGSEKPSATQPRAFSFSQLAGTDWKATLPRQAIGATTLIAPVGAGSPLAPLMGQQIQPIATPVVFSGISQESLALFSADLSSNGLLPVAGVGGAAPITPLAPFDEKTLLPGSTVSVQLVRGDYSIAAAGTVTFRDGERIYAFGHPFLSLGTADMPMTEGSVVTVIPSTYNSFKLAVPGQMVGSISQDRATGVFGELGHAPKMIPVKVNLHTSRGRTEVFSYEVVSDEFLTPLLVNLTVFNSISARERSLGDATVSIRGEIKIKGQEPVTIERRFSNGNAALLAAGSVAMPVSVLLGSGFDNVDINGVEVDVTASDARNTATLERISLDRTEIDRGERMEIQAYVRTDSGKQFVERIPVDIPADVPAGQLVVFVGDGSALQESSAARSLVPRDLGQLVSTINKVKKNDRLYVRLYRVTPGVVIGNSEFPNLPPSIVATLNNDRSSGGYTATALSPIYERELAPAEFVINGQQVVSIIVR